MASRREYLYSTDTPSRRPLHCWSAFDVTPARPEKVEGRRGGRSRREAMPGRCPTHEPRALFCSAMASAAFLAFAVQCLELGAALGLCRRGAPNFSQAFFVRSAKAVKSLSSRSGRVIVAHWLRPLAQLYRVGLQ